LPSTASKLVHRSRRALRPSPLDSEIFTLALPALGALAAEPLYLLADTAIVGHLGTPQLAALALASTLLTGLATFCNFLVYGVTAQVARLHGAGERERAGAVGPQSLWVALTIGVPVAAIAAALAPVAISVLGGSGEIASMATTFLRIGCIGLPCALIAMAGQGYQRGLGQLRGPLIVIVVANVFNVALELLFVYGLHWGLVGSAWGTVIAQVGMATVFTVTLLTAPTGSFGRRPRWSLMRPLLRMGGALVIRTASLYGAFLVASAVLARVSSASLAAHQIGMQIFNLLALVLDAIAIAGQVIVGRNLGAGDGEAARASAIRMIELSVAGGIVIGVALMALRGVIPEAFTSDPQVIDQAQALWPMLALMQPFGAAVFALDGILLGAGETSYLAWSMVLSSVVYVGLALLALTLHWGVVGVWAGFNVLMLVRLITCWRRFRSERWIRLGATA
jgi:putative MATE family efflux protein